MIDTRFHEFQERDPDVRITEDDLSSETRQRLAHITEGISKTDMDIRKITADLEEYPNRLNLLMGEYPATIQAYAGACQKHERNQQRISELLAEQVNDEQAIKTLQNAFRALMARPEHQQPSPPASPPLPSCEMIVEAVEDGLRESLRAGLRMEVEEFRREVTAKMELEVDALVGGMMNRVGQTIGIIGGIADSLPGVQAQ